MVLLTITVSILEAIHLLQKSGKPLARERLKTEIPSNEPALGEACMGDPITHGQIIDLSKAALEVIESHANHAATIASSYKLETLLRGSRVYVAPPRPKAKPSSDYNALMARLRQEEESRAYERMIAPVMQKESFTQRFPNSQHAELFPMSKADLEEDDETTYTDINRQLGVIFNVIVSIVACSAAIWIVARHWSVPTRLALSMGGSGLVGAAEVVVYAGYLRRVKEAKSREKNAVEVKEVVDTWVITGKDAQQPHEQEAAGSDGMRKRLPVFKSS